MLHRDRQVHRQVHQVLDAVLFALSFWLAYQLRANSNVIDLFNLKVIHPFEAYKWLYLLLIPAAPLILEAQGFYQRPLFCSRRSTAWMLLKGCLLTSLVLILALFLSRAVVARGVVICFGFVSFGVVFAKEELLRWARRSKVAREQYRRRLILVGTREETRRLEAELKAKEKKL